MINFSEYITATNKITFSSSTTGMVRFNQTTGMLEVMDGNIWYPIVFSNLNIALTPKAEEILSWANKKMIEERDLTKLMEKYPALKAAKDQFELFKLMLIEEENK